MGISGWRLVLGKVFPSILPAEKKQFNLEELLDQLPPETRRSAEIGAVKAGFSESSEYAAKAKSFYADRKESSDEIARFEILSGNLESAIAIYEECRFSVDEAAEVAKKHIGIERAIKVYEDALAKGEAARHHERLAQLYEEQGDGNNARMHWRLAISGYEKESDVRKAAELERKHGSLAEVIEIYTRAAERTAKDHDLRGSSSYFQQGAKVAEEAENKEKAHQLYTWAFDALLEVDFLLDTETLINLAQKVGDKKKLITAYEKASQPQQAYKLALEEGYHDRAMEICSKVGVPEKLVDMAKFALDNGRADMAVKIYERACLDKEAARTASQHGSPQKALEICESKIDINYVCWPFEDPDYFDIAMDAASRIGDDERRKLVGHKAMERFSALGKFDVSAKFADKLGYNNLAGTYKSLASLPKA